MSESTPMRASATIRPFEPDDRRAFLSLYETVFDRERSVDWFQWRYEDNPYVDHVPIVVAEDDGDVVGCRAFFALEAHVEGTEQLAFQPCDTMVHPDYRGQGLFSRMNAFAVDRYTDGEPAFCFNFPNENSKPGNLKHGWKEIGTFPVYYRPQDPVGSVAKLTNDDHDADETRADGDGWVDGDTGPGVDRDLPADIDANVGSDDGAVDTLASLVTSSQQAGDRLVTDSSDGFAVVRFETPPAELLESVYRRSVPDGIHTNRTAGFYRWRFGNPAQSYTAYVATRDGETPVAALVTSRVDDHLRIVEALPREIDAEAEAIDRLLATALADRGNRNYVTAFGETLPSPIQYRFYPDTRFPLSSLIQPTARTLLARDLDNGVGIERTDADDWSLSRLDLDTT